ncbi:hypothetical protein [Streptomyces sp. NPDC127119]|uniref:hypothetical protein n=1 Tax=Streptomyces sp. NPDC127119 TaxID=3345370 RepID=UPI00364316CB
MANAFAASTANARRPADPTWHELAAVTGAKRMLWLRSRTRWAPCGLEWDTVAVEPMVAALDALTAMRAGTRHGYQVLADHLSDRLYIAVPTHGADAFGDIPGVRVLSVGHQLLIPNTPKEGTIVADWISYPHGSTPLLLAGARLAACLRECSVPTDAKATER